MRERSEFRRVLLSFGNAWLIVIAPKHKDRMDGTFPLGEAEKKERADNQLEFTRETGYRNVRGLSESMVTGLIEEVR